MMTIQQLFPNLDFKQDMPLHTIQNDSRKVDQYTLFIAYTGFEVDVHRFITDAYDKGCRAFLVSSPRVEEFQDYCKDALFIASEDLKLDTAHIASKFYDYPDQKLIMIGITGTNGKTTTATLINQSLRLMGEKTASFGTIEWCVGEEYFTAVNTTPDYLTLIKFLRKAVDQNISYVVMEVASHALSMGRVEGLNFDYALFTNLTQDHLDYHGTLEDYYLAKRKLFLEFLAQSTKTNKRALINADDPYGQQLLKILGERGIPTDSLSLKGKGLWNADNISLTVNQTSFTIHHLDESTDICINLLGKINVQNTMMAFVLLKYLGYDSEKILKTISQITILGRLQKIESSKGVVFLVDYAHTPDALEKAIAVVNDTLAQGKKSIVVFGAGGDRDVTKRPLMAKASTNADIIIVTSDNPRTENPESIIQDIFKGFDNLDNIYQDNIYQEIDRKKALELAYDKAQKGDVVLVAGKGHEDYQIIGTTKIHFSDVEEIQKIITKKEHS